MTGPVASSSRETRRDSVSVLVFLQALASTRKHSQAFALTHSQNGTIYLSTEFKVLLMSGPTGKTLDALNATAEAQHRDRGR